MRHSITVTITLRDIAHRDDSLSASRQLLHLLPLALDVCAILTTKDKLSEARRDDAAAR